MLTCFGHAQNLQTFSFLSFKLFLECLNKLIAPCPSMAIFGVPPDSLMLSKAEANCIIFSTLLARCLILFRWKDAHPPTFIHWVRDILYFLKLEKIKHSLRGSIKTYHKMWNPFLDYIEEKFQFPAVPWSLSWSLVHPIRKPSSFFNFIWLHCTS